MAKYTFYFDNVDPPDPSVISWIRADSKFRVDFVGGMALCVAESLLEAQQAIGEALKRPFTRTPDYVYMREPGSPMPPP